MKTKNNFLPFLPIWSVFILLNGLLLIFRYPMEKTGFDMHFVLITNTVLFVLSLLGFYIQKKQVNNKNPHAFVRGVYGSTLLKMMVIMAALFIFIVASGGTINKRAIFLSMGIYLLYTTIEVVLLMKMVRNKK